MKRLLFWKKQLTWLGLCTFIATAMALTWQEGHRKKSSDLPRGELNFPFEVLGETRLKSLNASIRRVAVFLPEQFYSRENLDSLFRSYSKQFSNKNEMADVYVYTDKERFKQDQDKPVELYSMFDGSGQSSKRLFDALFVRDVFRGDYAHVNEKYLYWVKESDEYKTVVLKGRPRTGKDIILEAWETRRKDWTISVTKYKTQGVEPMGYYYTFESDNPAYQFPHELLTFRQDDPVEIPRGQVRFVNDKIAYMFMGYMVAVTTDGGHSCAVWDAETDFASWQYSDRPLIRDVRINADGVGIMLLQQESAGISAQLHTNDYGRTWAMP
jgi:hypothetical protein